MYRWLAVRHSLSFGDWVGRIFSKPANPQSYRDRGIVWILKWVYFYLGFSCYKPSWADTMMASRRSGCWTTAVGKLWPLVKKWINLIWWLMWLLSLFREILLQAKTLLQHAPVPATTDLYQIHITAGSTGVDQTPADWAVRWTILHTYWVVVAIDLRITVEDSTLREGRVTPADTPNHRQNDTALQGR